MWGKNERETEMETGWWYGKRKGKNVKKWKKKDNNVGEKENEELKGKEREVLVVCAKVSSIIYKNKKTVLDNFLADEKDTWRDVVLPWNANNSLMRRCEQHGNLQGNWNCKETYVKGKRTKKAHWKKKKKKKNIEEEERRKTILRRNRTKEKVTTEKKNTDKEIRKKGRKRYIKEKKKKAIKKKIKRMQRKKKDEK